MTTDIAGEITPEITNETEEIQSQVFPHFESIIYPDGSLDTAAERQPRRIGLYARRALAATAMFGTAVGGGLAAIELSPSTSTSVAGLEASVHPRIGHDFSQIDLGLLGGGIGRTHATVAGVNVGADVRIDGKNLDLSDSATRTELAQIAIHPQPQFDRIKRETIKSSLEYGLAGSGATLLIEMAAVGLVMGRRRDFGTNYEGMSEGQQRRLKREAQAFVAAVVIGGAAINTLGYWPIIAEQHTAIESNPFLAGTPLDSWEIDGPAQDVVPVIDGAKSTEKFDEKTEANSVSVLKHRPELQAKDGWEYIVVADDLQDVDGMARQFGVIIKTIHANLGVMTGDWAYTSEYGLGSHIIDTVRYESGYAPIRSTPGNHDTDQTIQYENASGVDVADNKTHEVDGIKMLFLRSVDVASGISSVLRDPSVDQSKAIADAVAEICSTHPDFVFLHDHHEGRDIAEEAIKAGCAPKAIIDGRSFNYVGPQTISLPGYNGVTVEYTSGSSGGHRDTAFNAGPIQHDAPISIFAVNKTTGEVRYTTETFHPDATVTIPHNMKILVPANDSGDGTAKRADGKQAKQTVTR